jgi:pyruvate carboxylase
MIQSTVKLSFDYKPNVVFNNAGTNDCAQNIDIGNAGERMRALINIILSAEGMDKTTIVLSALIPSTGFNIQINRPQVNMQYRILVEELQAAGVHIVLADMIPSIRAWAMDG